jgi:hypothetical protein
MVKKWFALAVLTTVAIILATAAFYNFYYKNKKHTDSNLQADTDPVRIATIGSENFYQSNFNLYQQKYPDQSAEQLWERIKHDSARLQYGATIGVLNLDSTFYNSSNWDLAKRLDQVNKVTIAQQAKKKYTYSVLTIYFNSDKNSQGEELQKKQSQAIDLINKLSETYVDFKRRSEAGNLIEMAKKLDPRNGESPFEIKYLDQVLPDPAFSNIYTPSVLSTETQKWSAHFLIYDADIPVAVAKTYTLNQSEVLADQTTANNFPKYLEEISFQRFTLE